MNENKDFMKEAITESAKNLETGHGGPFGAVVVKDGKIVNRSIGAVPKQEILRLINH